MKRITAFTTLTAISVLMASQAFATDYNSGVVTKSPSAEYTDVEFGSGWYLRGDISYNIRGNSNSAFTSISTGSDVGDIQAQGDYDDSVGARVGFGNYITSNVRLEAAAEQIFDSNFDSVRALNQFATEQTNLAYNARSFFVNGYFDLPNLGQIKPYVGAGAGLSRLSYNFTQTFTCNSAAEFPCGTPGGSLAPGESGTVVRNSEDWVTAYQVGGGLGFQIDDHWTADVGYTYTSYGDGGEINYDDGSAIDSGGFDIHQVRLGLRYDLW